MVARNRLQGLWSSSDLVNALSPDLLLLRWFELVSFVFVLVTPCYAFWFFFWFLLVLIVILPLRRWSLRFIREALQNAEDTNKSTHFCAVLDLQHHPKKRIRQDCQPWRERLQGPAILFYDDGGFDERDWQSLQRIYDSEKRHSPSEVGKYGMGSRSFFHIGDVIQIISGTTYAVLDPDERVSGKGDFGACLDFVNERFDGKRFFDRYPDEGAPFRDFFGCNLQSSFKGTIIRAPWL